MSDIGYYFPNPTYISILKEHRTGTWNTAVTNPEHAHENHHGVFYIEHGTKPDNATYSYVILPGQSPCETEAYAKNPNIEIIENSPSAHGVIERENHLTCINFGNDSPYTVANITADTKCCVILKNHENRLELAISDSTNTNSKIVLQLDNKAKNIIAADANIEVLSLSPLTIQFNCAHYEGESAHIIVETL